MHRLMNQVKGIKSTIVYLSANEVETKCNSRRTKYVKCKKGLEMANRSGRHRSRSQTNMEIFHPMWLPE